MSEDFDWKKFLSRKFLSTWLELFLIILVPIIYQKIGIGTEVQLMVVGMIGVGAGVYKWANVKEKLSIDIPEPKEEKVTNGPA